ncbi:MAG: beta-1,6-N-acetylglucosaminyltransferase [Leptolyngbyaceae bacterium]|nr:beta-1,6-N-acetylglucosaminyltransferase [Leptolyngbyaceae bacterium]
MKVCYLIQTHTNPRQIYRLVQTIKQSSPNALILISHDCRHCPLDRAPLKYLSEVYLLQDKRPRKRGEFSLIQPYFEAIEWAFRHNLNFDWVSYLSGQDYPTQSLAKFNKLLASTTYDGFMQYFDVFSSDSLWDAEEAIKRYYCQYYRPPEWTSDFLLKISRIQDFLPIILSSYFGSPIMGVRSKSTPFNKNFICYGGSQWHTLSRKCVAYLRDFVRNNHRIVNYYKGTYLSDESFMQTALINSGLFKICNDNHRYVDFIGTEAGHARVLNHNDYQLLASEEFYFARKFNPDSRILDMLDTRISQQDSMSQPEPVFQI